MKGCGARHPKFWHVPSGRLRYRFKKSEIKNFLFCGKTVDKSHFTKHFVAFCCVYLQVLLWAWVATIRCRTLPFVLARPRLHFHFCFFSKILKNLNYIFDGFWNSNLNPILAFNWYLHLSENKTCAPFVVICYHVCFRSSSCHSHFSRRFSSWHNYCFCIRKTISKW